MSGANYRAASAEKGKQAETFSLLIPAASFRATQLSSAAENLQSIGGNSIQGEHLLDGKAADEKHMTSITSFKSKRQRYLSKAPAAQIMLALAKSMKVDKRII